MLEVWNGDYWFILVRFVCSEYVKSKVMSLYLWVYLNLLLVQLYYYNCYSQLIIFVSVIKINNLVCIKVIEKVL